MAQIKKSHNLKVIKLQKSNYEVAAWFSLSTCRNCGIGFSYYFNNQKEKPTEDDVLNKHHDKNVCV